MRVNNHDAVSFRERVSMPECRLQPHYGNSNVTASMWVLCLLCNMSRPSYRSKTVWQIITSADISPASSSGLAAVASACSCHICDEILPRSD